MTGIGINLREVPDDNGGVKLKVLGLILDGPAHTAGVQQVQTVGLSSKVIYIPINSNAMFKEPNLLQTFPLTTMFLNIYNICYIVLLNMHAQ